MQDISTLTIPDEAAAWALLSDAINDRLPDGTLHLEFGDWVQLHLKYSGIKFNSTITPGMMDAFIDLQSNIYRLFAKLHYNNPQAKVLTNEQRAALEILVKVEPGSSEITALFKDALDKITLGAINKMDAKHYVIIILAGILSFASTTAWKDYLKSQDESKKAELNIAMSQLEADKMKIVQAAAKQEPYVISMTSDANEFRNKVLKSAKSADSIHVAGQTLTKVQAAQLTRSSRTASTEVRLDGTYKIIKVDSSDIDRFNVTLESKEGKSFRAELQNGTLAKSKNMDKIQAAEWNRSYIDLEINGKEVRGEVTVATIMGVKETKPQK